MPARTRLDPRTRSNAAGLLNLRHLVPRERGHAPGLGGRTIHRKNPPAARTGTPTKGAGQLNLRHFLPREHGYASKLGSRGRSAYH